ncbi:MAG: YheT family hydrolase [Lewinella sp.]
MLSRLKAHYQTIAPNILRSVNIDYRRERMELPDGDFVDLDWLDHPDSRKLVILSHGLEGDSRRVYVASAASFFHQRGWHALAWNCRSCSGEMNRTARLYSHGQTEDLEAVVNHALATGKYDRVVMVGYSMGGNMTLKYLGTMGHDRPREVTHGVAFSAPVFIEHSADSLDRFDNFIYRIKFKKAITAKLRIKEAQFPGRFDFSLLKDVRRWRDYDDFFSRRTDGFTNLDDYYAYLSSGNFVGGTTAPVLIVNAINDPIVPDACNPHDLAKSHPLITLETPDWGGHVGFALKGKSWNWMDERALEFCAQ